MYSEEYSVNNLLGTYETFGDSWSMSLVSCPYRIVNACWLKEVDGWLGFTALQHNKGYIAPVSVVNVRMSAHAGLVGSNHLVPLNSG